MRPIDFKNYIPIIEERWFDSIYDNYSKNTSNTSNISRFFKKGTLVRDLDSATLRFSLPNDYKYHRGILQFRSVSFPNFRSIDIMTDIEYITTQQSYILSPKLGKEKATIENSKIIVLPLMPKAEVEVCDFPYIRKPQSGEFEYSVTEQGALLSDNDAGFDFEEDNLYDLVFITLEIFGVQMKRQDIYQYTAVQQINSNK